MPPPENCPPVRVRGWVRVRFWVGDNFPRGNCPRTPKNYNDVFVEQKKFEIIEPATEIALPGNCQYIPQHPVREKKINCKLRIVFDASATSEGAIIYI